MRDLADRYRRLLRWYPRDYRRERGEELVGMLLELAPPGRKPSVREMVNLFRNGMRCRLGRPASRYVVILALATCLISGLFSAAWASRAAWETARPLSSTEEAQTILAEVLPGEGYSQHTPADPPLFAIDGQSFSMDNLPAILRSSQASTTQFTSRPAGPYQGDPWTVVAEMLPQLRNAGWRTHEPFVREVHGCRLCDPAGQVVVLYASRGDNVLELTVDPNISAGETYIAAQLSRATPWVVYPVSAVAGLIGALVGWLVFGWASRRLERRNEMVRTMVVLAYALTMVLWWIPALESAPFLIARQLSQPNPRWYPLWEWLGQPWASSWYLAGWASALLAMTVAALPSRRAGAAAKTRVPA